MRTPNHRKNQKALDAFASLWRASESLGVSARRSLKGKDLTSCQFGVLEVLYRLGPLCQYELGDNLSCTGGNVTVVVDNLEKRGIVRRERCCEDRRQIYVHLTKTGRGLISQIFPKHVSGIAQAMAQLTRQEQKILERLCQKLNGRNAKPKGNGA